MPVNLCVYSSPEPSGSQGEIIVYPCSGVCCRRRCCHRHQQFQTSSPMKTLGQSNPNFMWSFPWKREKVCINGPGHMTNMAATTIYCKNLKKSSFPEPEVACNDKKSFFSLLQTIIEDNFITFGLVRMFVTPYHFSWTIFSNPRWSNKKLGIMKIYLGSSE